MSEFWDQGSIGSSGTTLILIVCYGIPVPGGPAKVNKFCARSFFDSFFSQVVEFFDSAAVRQPAKSLRLAGGAVARGAQGS